MKKIVVFISCLLFLSCNTENDTGIACGCEEPQKELSWLKNLIQKAETDETGNYSGYIWLEKYKGKDYFVTNMMLGSGGIAYWVFDCSGRHYVQRGVENCPACQFVGNKHIYYEEDFLLFSELKKNVVIYFPAF